MGTVASIDLARPDRRVYTGGRHRAACRDVVSLSCSLHWYKLGSSLNVEIFRCSCLDTCLNRTLLRLRMSIGVRISLVILRLATTCLLPLQLSCPFLPCDGSHVHIF